ncbi:MAG: hypothetical protein WA369_11050 [Candidatus Acidiferrales bacterium]
MFCPVCKTEYRPGFTKCADCGVALVDQLPARGEDVQTDAEGRELLWSGPSSKLCDTIRDALDVAGISHKDVEKEFGVLPTFAQNAQLIWIQPHDRDAARAILRKVLTDGDPADAGQRDSNSDNLAWMDPFRVRPALYAAQSATGHEEGEELADSAERRESTPDDIPENFNPGDASSEVWAGEDAEMAEFLRDSLRGVGIGCVVSEGAGKGRVLVLPADEARAKEIVREVVEGAPPV